MEWAHSIANVAVRLPDREVPFRIFDNPTSRDITTKILQGKSYPPWAYVRDVKTIVDIGANVGAASLYFASGYPQAQIFAFEPFAPALQLLRDNLAPFPHVHVFDYGLLDRHCETPLYLSRYDAVTNSVGKSALNGQQSVVVKLRDARQVFRELQIDAVDILKIDTEGCELPILKSLSHLLKKVQVLYVEYHAESDRLALDELLRDTHMLVKANVAHPHRGEMCYASYESFPTSDDANAMRIALPP